MEGTHEEDPGHVPCKSRTARLTAPARRNEELWRTSIESRSLPRTHRVRAYQPGHNTQFCSVSEPLDDRMNVADPGHRALRDTFAQFASGVTVVTVAGASMHGMTASSFTSVSLDPPLVLVCVDKTAFMHGRINSETYFGVSVLTCSQGHLARHFADPTRPTNSLEFNGVDWVAGPRTGVPLMNRAAACLECQRHATYDAGDHTIVVGRVLSHENCHDAEGLIFHDGQLRGLPHLDLTGRVIGGTRAAHSQLTKGQGRMAEPRCPTTSDRSVMDVQGELDESREQHGR